MDNMTERKFAYGEAYPKQGDDGNERRRTMLKQAHFKDRRDAGRKLGKHLQGEIEGDIIVIGLPRGGVEVAFEVARALKAPLDVIVARKIGAPMQPELGIGAVAPGGIMILDEGKVRQLGLSDEQIEKAAEKERTEMRRRLKEYRGEENMPDLSGKTAVIVDDGLATGVTARASIRAARAAGAKRIILAIPVCAKESATEISDEVDRLICLEAPERFVAVGIWYEQFDQTTDAHVIELMEEAREIVPPKEFSEI